MYPVFHVVWRISDEDIAIKVLKLLTDFGASLDARSVEWSLLMHSLYYEKTKIFKFLLESGANPDVRKPGEECAPLAYAVHNDMREEAALLLKAGADVEIEDEIGDTPLVDACRLGHFEMAKILLEAGAYEVDALEMLIGERGDEGNEKMIDLLLEYEVTPTDSDGSE